MKGLVPAFFSMLVLGYSSCGSSLATFICQSLQWSSPLFVLKDHPSFLHRRVSAFCTHRVRYRIQCSANEDKGTVQLSAKQSINRQSSDVARTKKQPDALTLPTFSPKRLINAKDVHQSNRGSITVVEVRKENRSAGEFWFLVSNISLAKPGSGQIGQLITYAQSEGLALRLAQVAWSLRVLSLDRTIPSVWLAICFLDKRCSLLLETLIQLAC